MVEQTRHKQAFEYYYCLGKDRSISKVADRFGVSRVSVNKWANQLDWAKRVEERDDENLRFVREKNDSEIRENIIMYKKLIRASITEYYKSLKGGTIKIDCVNDLAKLIKLDLDISDYVEERCKEAEENNKNSKAGNDSAQTKATIELIFKNLESANLIVDDVPDNVNIDDNGDIIE